MPSCQAGRVRVRKEGEEGKAGLDIVKVRDRRSWKIDMFCSSFADQERDRKIKTASVSKYTHHPHPGY